MYATNSIQMAMLLSIQRIFQEMCFEGFHGCFILLAVCNLRMERMFKKKRQEERRTAIHERMRETQQNYSSFGGGFQEG